MKGEGLMVISIMKAFPGSGETTLTALAMNCISKWDTSRIEFVAQDRVMKDSQPGELEGDGYRQWVIDFDRDPWVRGRDFSDLQHFDLPKKPDYCKNFPWFYASREKCNDLFCAPDTHYFLSLGLNRRATEKEICLASIISDYVLLPIPIENDHFKISSELLRFHLKQVMKADIVSLDSIFIAAYDPHEGSPVFFHNGFKRYRLINISKFNPQQRVSETPSELIEILDEIVSH